MSNLQIQDVFQPYYAGCREAERARPPKRQAQGAMPARKADTEKNGLPERVEQDLRTRPEHAARES